jgi:hypothetical protein
MIIIYYYKTIIIARFNFDSSDGIRLFPLMIARTHTRAFNIIMTRTPTTHRTTCRNNNNNNNNIYR